MFGTSGIRGPVGETVTAELSLAVGRALGAESDVVVVGRDPRESGRLLVDAIAAGLRETGTDVVDVGLAATPTVARGVDWCGADAGVAVTASHNPPPDNGIKLWQPSGQAFDAQRRNRIAARVDEDETELVAWDQLGCREQESLEDQHRRRLVESVTVEDPLTVVVDVGNGAGAVTAEALVALGCQVQTLNAQPDGSFPSRPSEPTADNCDSLCAVVGASDADLGIAHDGDADRTMAVDETGEFVSGDVLLTIFARDQASEGDVVALPVDTSLAVEDTLGAAGVSVTRTQVGDVHVAAAASRDEVVFGGEPSGAWIWPQHTLCPDGPLAACKLASLVADQPLSTRVDTIETYPIRRTAIDVEHKQAVMEAVRASVRTSYDDVSSLDGVRVDLGDAWFLVRASGTQPLVRVTAEARTTERAAAVFEAATEIVSEAS